MTGLRVRATTRPTTGDMQSGGANLRLARAVGEFRRAGARFAHGPLAYPLSGSQVTDHSIYSYPARMVSDLQGHLLDVIKACGEPCDIAFDPFMGGGTTMVEAMLRGMDFVGCDINPLSVLVCEVLSKPIEVHAVRKATQEVLAAATGTGSATPPTFKGRDYWYDESTVYQLASLREAILRVPRKRTRRFLWVALAETARRCSLSRNTTYKLHRVSRPDGIKNAMEVFRDTAWASHGKLVRLRERLDSRGFLVRGAYAGRVQLFCVDCRYIESRNGKPMPDVVITSPPYGDNKTTIPYGQHSFLPLQWIPLKELPPGATSKSLAGPCLLDSASLGGGMVRDQGDIETLSRRSPYLRQLRGALANAPPDRLGRVFGFARDFVQALQAIDAMRSPGALGVWTLGSRTVHGVPIHLHRVLLDGLPNLIPIARMERRIPRKRLAPRNATTSTINQETILITRFA